VHRSLSFGLVLAFSMSLTVSTGCSRQSTTPMEDVKIKGLSPGAYRDSVEDVPAKGKPGRGARTKPR
jgi:hypothetical protein